MWVKVNMKADFNLLIRVWSKTRKEMGKKRRWFNFSYPTCSHLYLCGACLSLFAYAFILPRFLLSNFQSNVLGWNEMIKRILCLNAEAHELGLSGLWVEQSCLCEKGAQAMSQILQGTPQGPPLIFLSCRSGS